MNFKKHILQFLWKLIEVIEKFQYWKLKLDEEDISKKILESFPLEEVEVLSDGGWVKASELHITQPYTHYHIVLENGMELECADNHRIFTSELQEIFVRDLTSDAVIYTISGPSKIKEIRKLNRKSSMGDLSIDHPTHRYFTNGILSHNTISVSIFILHYITFNNNKNVMIAADQWKTVYEILDKIKDIYAELPYFLQPGIMTWQQKGLSFDTDCRILGQGRSKSGPIGFAIDLLYIDEFAKIPKNFITPFWVGTYPTVSSIQNHKIFITSTPEGHNLFYDLFNKAEENLPGNKFKAKRVYWWQVEGRIETKINPALEVLNKRGLSLDDLEEAIKSQIPPTAKFRKKAVKDEDGIYHDEFWVYPDEGCAFDDINNLRVPINMSINGETKIQEVPLTSLSYVSSWKQEQISDMGEEGFAQEFDIRFINGSKILFDEHHIKGIRDKIQGYKHYPLPILNRLPFEVKELEWVKNKDIFDINKIKDYYIIGGVDLGEGLGHDHSCINIFRIMPKSPEEYEKITSKDFKDYFKLVQIGIWRYNRFGVKDVAHLTYLLFWEFFNNERIRLVVEHNNYGREMLGYMPDVFGGKNDYGDWCVLRYLHTLNSKFTSPGLKITPGNKNMYVKEFQSRVKKGDLDLNHLRTFKEITTFVKKETPAGNIQYQAESGHDDLVMTLVGISTVFDNLHYQGLLEEMWEDLEPGERMRIERMMNKSPDNVSSRQVDYGGFLDTIAKNRGQYPQSSPDEKFPGLFNRPKSRGLGY